MQELYQRPHSPFDDTAIERLRRMGLVTAEARPDRDVMNIFSMIFAGQFYDDLCDYSIAAIVRVSTQSVFVFLRLRLFR